MPEELLELISEDVPAQVSDHPQAMCTLPILMRRGTLMMLKQVE